MKITDLNISVLGELAAGRQTFPNQMEATAVPHIRRCAKLGLVEVVRSTGLATDRTVLRLTEAGVAAINASIARFPSVHRYPPVMHEGGGQ